MSKDGLIPKVFSVVHPKFRTPAKNNLLFMLFVSIFAAFVPARVVGEMTSIGTLFAFILVCIGVIVMRRKMPEAPRAFVTPLVPLVPILGVITCLFMMVFLPPDTWIRLVVWMLIGLDVYAYYGIKNSVLGEGKTHRKGVAVMNVSGLALAVLLAIVGLWEQATIGWNADKTLLIISFAFSALHIGIFSAKLGKKSV